MQYFLIGIFIAIYQYYLFVWEIIIGMIGPFCQIYYLQDNEIKNITVPFYTGIGIDKYYHGKFFIKIYGKKNIEFMSHHGNLREIKESLPDIFMVSPDEKPVRKKVIFYNNDQPINFDLNLLDNYFRNSWKNNPNHFDLETLLKIFGYQCTHITFINNRPFRKIKKEIQEVSVNELYDVNSNTI